MVQNKKNVKRRQAVKSRVPSSARKQISKQSTPVKKRSKSRFVANTSKKVTKTPIKKGVIKKVAPSKQAAQKSKKQIHLPIGRGRRLTVAIQISLTPAKKARVSSKKQKSLKKLQARLSIIMIAVGFAGSAHFGMQVFAAGHEKPLLYKGSSNIRLESGPRTPSLPASNATHIEIPAIALDAEVVGVGKHPDGTLEVPSDYSKVGQYLLGPTPGELGPAIIDGHVDSYKGIAVFWRLRELKPGDSINIVRQDGKIAVFKVNAVEEYSQSAFPTEKVYGNINHAGLRLITCGGSFDLLTRHYNKNTVVYASLQQ